jgi:hypothetical protein
MSNDKSAPKTLCPVNPMGIKISHQNINGLYIITGLSVELDFKK